MIGVKSMCVADDFAFFLYAGMIGIADWPHTQQQKKMERFENRFTGDEYRIYHTRRH